MNKAIIFDLDGTIYFGDTLAYYAQELISELRCMGYEIIFFTNNSTKTREEIFTKLNNLSIITNIENVYTSAYATAIYLKQEKLMNIFLIGTDSFKSELNNFNIEVVDEMDAEAEAVVIGLDIEFNYTDIGKALIFVNNGAKIIASNVDRNYPVENNALKPGSNAIVSSLLGACDNKGVDFIVGKPNTFLLEIICKDFNLKKDNIWVIGDSYASDIAMANNYACKSVLVDQNNNLETVLNIIKEGNK